MKDLSLPGAKTIKLNISDLSDKPTGEHTKSIASANIRDRAGSSY